MATEELVAGNQSTFTPLVAGELNALASGNAVLGASPINNSANNDLFAEFSFASGGALTTTGVPFVGLFIYPQNGDGSSYGDGRFGTAAAGPPPSNYYRGFMGAPVGTQTVTGFFAVPGTSNFMLPLPRGIFRVALHNGLGVALAATGNVL